MCEQLFQVLDENGNPIAYNAEAGAYSETGEGGSSTTNSEGICVVELDEGTEYEAFARGYKSTPDAPDYSCLDCRRTFTACTDTIILTLKHGLPSRKYVLHMSVLEKSIEKYPEWTEGAHWCLYFIDRVISDDSVHEGPFPMRTPGFGCSPWLHFREPGDFEIDITRHLEDAPVLEGGVITIAAREFFDSRYFLGDYKNVLASSEYADLKCRPRIDVYDGDVLVAQRYPIGDIYTVYPEHPPLSHGHEDKLIIEAKHGAEEFLYCSFAMSFALEGLPPLPSPPPFGPTERIGIRGI